MSMVINRMRMSMPYFARAFTTHSRRQHSILSLSIDLEELRKQNEQLQQKLMQLSMAVESMKPMVQLLENSHKDVEEVAEGVHRITHQYLNINGLNISPREIKKVQSDLSDRILIELNGTEGRKVSLMCHDPCQTQLIIRALQGDHHD